MAQLKNDYLVSQAEMTQLLAPEAICMLVLFIAAKYI
jgi:hypothetical protein